MATRSTFIEKTVKCPVCFVNVPLTYPNPRTYSVSKKDSDGRPVEYRWLAGHDESVHPHYYSVWQCPQCLFANFLDSILDPKGALENYVREAYKKIPEEGLMFLGQLSGLVTKDKETLNGAIAKHLAAIYTTHLPEDKLRDYNKLGRLYLRLGWLYREANILESDQHSNKSIEALQLQTRNMVSLAEQYRNFSVDLSSAVETRANELTKLGKPNPYAAILKAINTKISEFVSLQNMLDKTIDGDIRSATESISSSNQESSATLESALLKAKQKWPDIPMDEKASLVKSADNFEFALKEAKVYKTAEKALNVANLMVRILQRNKENERILDIINYVARGGVSSKQEMSEKFAKLKAAGVASTEQQKAMQGKLSAIDNAINSLIQIKRNVINSLFKEHKQNIETILKTLPNASIEEKRTALQEANIPKGLIYDLINRGMIKDSKKKGLFSR